MKELNQYKDLPNTIEEDEAMESLAKLGGGVTLKDLLTQMGNDLTQPTVTKEEFMEYGMNNPLSTIHKVSLDAPVPQPSGDFPHNEQPNLEDVLQNIAEQFALLYTVIRKEKLQGNSQAQAETKAGENSLQETVGLVLQQADWFKDLIRVELVALDLEKIAEGAVESIVENEVESYFENRFDPSDHFDFGDAVSDCVSDQIDDVVSDKIDDAVDAYLTNATISISK